MIIPRKMNNEESKIYGAIILSNREVEIADGKFQAAMRRLMIYRKDNPKGKK